MANSYPNNVVKSAMETFVNNAMAGDQVLMGIMEDSNYPYANGNRPTGKITNTFKDGVVIQVSNGDVLNVTKDSYVPHKTFEFTQDTLNNIVNRNLDSVRSSAEHINLNEGPLNRRNASSIEVSKLKDEISSQITKQEKLIQELQNKEQEMQEFKKSVCKMFHGVATEVSKLNPTNSKSFCHKIMEEFEANKMSYRGVESNFSDSFSDSSENGLTDYF